MNTQAVTIVNQDTPAQVGYLDMLGSAANHAAAESVLGRYQDRKSPETTRRQAADIRLFATYLSLPLVSDQAIRQQIAESRDIEHIGQLLDAAGIHVPDMASDLAGWSGVTWGLVEKFNQWSLEQGYAIGSVNVRLATIKAYAKLAAKHGSLNPAQYSLIKAIEGYQSDEGRNVDKSRKAAKLETRRPDGKKAEPTPITLEQARALKQQPDTKKGRRDALLMCLLLDLGLRVGEIAGLNISSIDLQAGTLTFYRHKVDIDQILALTEGARIAARKYLDSLDQSDQDGPLFSGPCSGERICVRTINARVGVLGEKIGLSGLSPHDCRHYFVTNLVRNGTDMKTLQDAGGWSNPAMPLKYAASTKIANAGVKLTV